MPDGFSVFGEMDVDTISDNPWAVDNDWYKVEITKSYFSKDLELQDYWNVVYSIFEPDSKFHGRPIRERFEVYPEVKDFKELQPEQLTKLERLKQRMTKGYGLEGKALAEMSRKMEELIGYELYVKVKNNPGKAGTEYEKETFTNVADARKEMPGQAKGSAAQLSGLL